ncbi:MAG: 6-bladed beta-propeller [Candidatus Aminicenantales bacterium]
MRVWRYPVLLFLILFPVWATVLTADQNAPQKKAARNVIRLTPVVTISASAMPAGNSFGEIADLAFDEQKALYVCDAAAGNIKKFDAFGTFLLAIGRRGQGQGEFERPGEIEIFGDRVFVRDLGRPRISLFDLDGKFVSSVSTDDKEGEWKKFRVLPDGRFIAETEYIDRANRNAPQETRLALYASDFSRIKTIFHKAVRRTKYVADPVRMNVPLPFASSVEWDVTTEGKVVAGFSGDYEIEILDPDKGKLISWKHPFKPVVVTERDRKEYLAGLAMAASMGSSLRSGKSGAADIAGSIEFPTVKPAFERFMVNGRDRVWVFFWSADPKAKPVFESFDPDGSFRGRVTCEDEWPLSARIAFFQGGMWMATSGPGGAKIVRYQITN